MKKILRFLKRNIKNPAFILKTLKALFFDINLNINFIKNQEIIKMIKQGKSFIRFGDGEALLMNGFDIPYQKYSKKLKNGLFKIFYNYKLNKEYFIIGLPLYLNVSRKELLKKRYAGIWFPLKFTVKNIINKEKEYGDAHLFYYKGIVEKELESYLISKDIIFVTNKENIENLKKNLPNIYSKKWFIETKSQNSFEELNDTKNDIDKIIKDKKREDVIIIFASGPAGKILAYEYARNEIQSLDIGHGLSMIYNNFSEPYERQMRDLKTFNIKI